MRRLRCAALITRSGGADRWFGRKLVGRARCLPAAHSSTNGNKRLCRGEDYERTPVPLRAVVSGMTRFGSDLRQGERRTGHPGSHCPSHRTGGVPHHSGCRAWRLQRKLVAPVATREQRACGSQPWLSRCRSVGGPSSLTSQAVVIDRRRVRTSLGEALPESDSTASCYESFAKPSPHTP